MEKSFYEAKDKKEAMEIYLRGQNELYARIKNKLIRKKLENIFGAGSWNSLKILEVGPGGGIWTEFFLEKKAEVICVDRSEEILKANAELHPEAKFIFADATDIKLNAKFDLVFAKDVIEHIKNDEKFLINMNSHLKKGGLIMINTQNSWSLNYLLQGSYHFIRGDKNWKGWDPTHVRFYNMKSLKNKLKKSGFKPIKWFGAYYFPYRILFDRFKISEKFLVLFCFIELLGLYNKFPFNVLGWSIGVTAKKNGKRNF